MIGGMTAVVMPCYQCQTVLLVVPGLLSVAGGYFFSRHFVASPSGGDKFAYWGKHSDLCGLSPAK